MRAPMEEGPLEAVHPSKVSGEAHLRKHSLSPAEYALSLIVLFGGWLVALFTFAGQVRPAGLTAFAITAAAGLGFVVFSWFIYGSNIQTLMWVADLMEDRVLRTRENWKNETLRSFVEVGSWLHIMFRIYAVSESALVAAFCGSVVGAFCVVLGDYFTEYARAAEQRLFAQAENSFVGYKYLRRLSGDEVESEAKQEDEPDELEAKPSDPQVELASVFYTPQFVSLLVCFALAVLLYHVQGGQDLGLAVILTTFANVAFITAEQLLMLWKPTRWAAIILHDRVLNVVYNWEHETIRSGFETCFYLSSIFSCYALTESVPVAVLVGTFAGMSIVLVSSWIGIGQSRVRLSDSQQYDMERSVFMLAIFGWACATLLYTIFVFSRSSLLALGLVVPTAIASICLAELAVATPSGAPSRETLQDSDSLSDGTELKPPSQKLLSKWSVFQTTVGSLVLPWKNGALAETRTLPPVQLATVLQSEASGELFARIEEMRKRFARKSSRVVRREELLGNKWVILEGFVFDVEKFAEKHPGGTALLLKYAERQSDISDQFAAFHHPSIYDRLLPLLVGKLQEQSAAEATEDKGEKRNNASMDYRRLRSYLWKMGYFDGAESDFESAQSCARQHLIVLSLGILAVCQVALLGHNLASATAVERDYFTFTLRKYLQCVLAGVTLGFFWQQVAFIAHDALHNGVVNRTKELRSRSPLVPNNVLGWFHGSICFGISSAMWLDEHSVHHAVTMRPCEDSQFNYLPMWCVSLKEFSTRFWLDMRDSFFLMPLLTKLLIAVQHWTLLPLAVLVGRFNFYALNIVYAVKHGIYYDLAGMAIFWAAYSGLLFTLSSDVGLQICFVLVSHWTVGILHVQLLINHLATDAFTADEEEELEFFSFQIKTTRNIVRNDSTDWFHGGLQYQIEHHLFPQLPRHRLALVQPVVREICQKNDLTYEIVPFFTAIRLCLENFRDIADEVWYGNIAI